MKSKEKLTKLYFRIGNKQGYTFWNGTRLIKVEYIDKIEGIEPHTSNDSNDSND